MKIEDISFPTAIENILYDKILLESAEANLSGEVLRFWEAERSFIVLGKTSKLEEDVNIDAARKDDIEIVRRISGGGTVLQGPGSLNYSFVFSYERNSLFKDIRKSYEIILNKICNSLKKLNIEATFEPTSDIAFCSRKFSGNAQSRRRKYMLHHGTILYGFALEIIENYLKMPKDQPLYRKGRSHRDFLININADPRDIKNVIASEFYKG
jgi:lipoate-protein ligase A